MQFCKFLCGAEGRLTYNVRYFTIIALGFLNDSLVGREGETSVLRVGFRKLPPNINIFEVSYGFYLNVKPGTAGEFNSVFPHWLSLPILFQMMARTIILYSMKT